MSITFRHFRILIFGHSNEAEACLDLRAGLAFLQSDRIPEDGTSVSKHLGD